MKDENKLGLLISFYLSKYDKIAYKELGYGTQRKTHSKIGKILNINPSTIQNWRDEFDPIHGHRKGWHQRPMTQSRINVVEAFQNLDEYGLRTIVNNILHENIEKKEEFNTKILQVIGNDDIPQKSSVFILRGPTGKKAENYFIEYFSLNQFPIAGILTDTREHGTGYDFKISTQEQDFFIEVKGIATETGGILFTSKEWNTARIKENNYFLAVVSNLNKTPTIDFIRNPYAFLKPQENIIQSIQVNYSVKDSDLRQLINSEIDGKI